jgi:hypothetical protein
LRQLCRKAPTISNSKNGGNLQTLSSILPRIVLLLHLLGIFGATATAAASAIAPDGGLLQTEIERQIKDVIAGQLAPGEYFVYATVKRISKDPGTAPEKSESRELPFTGLDVDRSFLRTLFEKNNPSELFQNYTITVTLALDERIPKSKREMIASFINDRFGFDGKQRVLNVKTSNLVTPPIALEKTLIFEKERLESDRAKLALETERAKLEISKRELEMAEKVKSTTDQAAASKAEQDEKLTATKKEAELKAHSDPLKDYQLLFFGAILVLITLIGAVASSGILKRGLTPLSSSLGKIGEGVKSSEGAGAPKAERTAPQAAPVAATAQHGESSPKAGADSHHGSPAIGDGDSSFAAFLESVQDKIEILVKKQSFGFYRQLADMIEDETSLPQAAALVVTLEDASAKILLQGLSTGQISKIRNYLESEGAFARSRSLRKAALQEFYGRIAMDEYLGSPLMQLKDLSWLTKMSNVEVGRTLLKLDKTEQVAFLASLTPHRVQKVIEAVSDQGERLLIIDLLSQLDAVDDASVVTTLAKISQQLRANEPKGQQQAAKALDSAKFIASVAENLSADNQNRLWESVSSKGDLSERIKEHYVPFSYVANLSKQLILEIFAPRSDAQIAQIVFDSKKSVQTAILKAMPEIRASNIEDEIGALQRNKAFEKRNRQISTKMQMEVSRYLLKLMKDGLLPSETAELRTESGNAA